LFYLWFFKLTWFSRICILVPCSVGYFCSTFSLIWWPLLNYKLFLFQCYSFYFCYTFFAISSFKLTWIFHEIKLWMCNCEMFVLPLVFQAYMILENLYFSSVQYFSFFIYAFSWCGTLVRHPFTWLILLLTFNNERNNNMPQSSFIHSSIHLFEMFYLSYSISIV
jgi:hypothetical protein